MTTRKKQQPVKKQENHTVAVIAGILIALFLEISNFDCMGTVGGWMKTGQTGLFGAMAYVLPVFVIIVIVLSSVKEKMAGGAPAAAAGLFLMIDVLAHLFSGIDLSLPVVDFWTIGIQSVKGGGIIGGTIAAGLNLAVSRIGAFIVVILLIFLCLFAIVRKQIFDAARERSEEKKRMKAAEKRAAKSYSTGTVAVTKKQGHRKETTVFETNTEEGTTIKIVHSPARLPRARRAKLERANNVSEGIRDGSVKTERSNKKIRGVGDNTSVGETPADTQAVHEITNAQPIIHRSQPVVTEDVKTEIPQEEKKNALKVTDVRSDKPTAEVEKILGKPSKPETVKESPRETAGEQRASLSGKVLSSGDPVKTFAPTHMERNNFKLPGMSLLNNSKYTQGQEDNVEETAATLEKVLETFGVSAKVMEIQVGPSVTRFELKPELGTRVSKVTSLADDLKLNLAVPEIRIEAPIPGKSLIGIEIPNKSRQTVYLKELLEAPELKNHKSKIAFAAGKDISGNVVVADIAKMPHILVAGTTGSGKSVFLNSIIMCILYRATPAEVGMIIIDPKKVEFGVYAGIPHLMKNVVSDPGQAVSTLRWAVAEMTERYQRMQMCGVRDFATYNVKYDAGEVSPEEENPRRMQQIVIVIDELADLMMVAAKEVESLICRLAQLARAAGIHLVIATQRPSVDVVTGLIKANIPARAALLVASGIDSRTIIDMVGAEKLMGNGDMLFYPTGYQKPVRVQGAFVSDEEIHKTVKFLIENKTEDIYAEDAASMDRFMSGESGAAGSGAEDESESGTSRFDDLFYDVGLMCIEQQKASSSMIQRAFSVGFNRAARIIDQLYEFGVVGPQNGSKPREILVDSITFKEMYEDLK